MWVKKVVFTMVLVVVKTDGGIWKLRTKRLLPQKHTYFKYDTWNVHGFWSWIDYCNSPLLPLFVPGWLVVNQREIHEDEISQIRFSSKRCLIFARWIYVKLNGGFVSRNNWAQQAREDFFFCSCHLEHVKQLLWAETVGKGERSSRVIIDQIKCRNSHKVISALPLSLA